MLLIMTYTPGLNAFFAMPEGMQGIHKGIN
jgi:hypothetical protein